MNTAVSYADSSSQTSDTRLGLMLRSLYAATPVAILLAALRAR
jgi:hypothetical protein